MTEQIDGGGGIGGGTSYTIRRLFTGAQSDVWQSAPFINGPANTDWFYLTNGKDRLTRWDGQATAATYSAITTIARSIAAFSNMLILANLVQSGVNKPADLMNTDLGDPESLLGLSEQFKVHDDARPIRKMLPLGDNLVIYSERNITLGQFVGDPLVFLFRKAVSDMGPVAARLVLDYGDFHHFIGFDGAYRFDGASLLPIGPQVFHELCRDLDPSRLHIGFGFIVEELGEAVYAIPLSSDGGTPPDSAITEHYQEQHDPRQPLPYAKRDFPFTAAGLFTQAATLTWDTMVGSWDSAGAEWDAISLLSQFPRVFAGDQNGNIFILNQGQSAAGVEMTSFIRFGRRPTIDGRERGLITRIYPVARDTTGTGHEIEVFIHTAEHANGPTTEKGPFVYSLAQEEEGAGEHYVTPYVRGRFFELEWRCSGSTTCGWGLTGYDWDGRRGGRR
jgi:hypothetical protein